MPLLQLRKFKNTRNTRFPRKHHTQTQRMHNCNKRYTTYEYLETVELMVRKKDGQLQRFDVNKIIRGLQKACEKRPVTMAQINELADQVRQDLMLKGTEEVASGEIGDLIMKSPQKSRPQSPTFVSLLFTKSLKNLKISGESLLEVKKQ